MNGDREGPWSVMPRLQGEINRLFGNAAGSESSGATAAWVPAVDISEFTDRFELRIDLPGVEPGEVELTLENGILALSGERVDNKATRSSEESQNRRAERPSGYFYRRFILPDSVDSEKVNAIGKNGVLTLTIAKQAKSRPRRIQISS